MIKPDILRKAFRWRKSTLPWYPRRGTRNDLAAIFAQLNYKIGVEVGTRDGTFAEILCKANPDLHLTCVDPWADAHIAPQYPIAVKRLAPYNTTLIKKTSMEAVGTFTDESLDFVYIDGNHHFDFVMLDLIYWAKKVKQGGVISLHDYAHEGGEVVHAVNAYTRSHYIDPWYVTRERIPSAFWIKS